MTASTDSPPPHRPALRKSFEQPGEYGIRQRSGWVLGPLLLVMTLVVPPPDGLEPVGWRTAGVAMLMAVMWISEALPIPATALLPLVLFPILGLADIKATAAPYADPIVFLFLGGFLLALAMQRWGLHRRLAIALIGALGSRPDRIVGGFLLATAFLSMWVSNTATALMMLPIATSVVGLMPERDRTQAETRSLGVALMLAVAYGATTGGLATLIGTPPNALLAAFVDRTYGITIGFAQWMLLGVPLALVSLLVVWFVLTRVAFRLPQVECGAIRELLAAERARLGQFRGPECIVAGVFSLVALAWMTRPLLEGLIPGLTDTGIAMAGALSLFLIPVDARHGVFVMNWETAKGVPWDVLLLFGGGLSLAAMIQASGLSAYLGTLAVGLGDLPIVVTLVLLCCGILFLTELTSNTATAASFLPVVAAVAVSLEQNPLLFLVPTALAASCSYMLPVGTPPNAIVFGSGLVTLPQMARVGFLLNLIMVPIIVAVLLLLGPVVLGLEINVLPDWAR